MKLKKSMAVVALALFSTFALAGVALAADADDSAESIIVTPQVIVDEANGVVLIGLPIDGELPECSVEDPTDPGDGTSADSTDDSADGEEGDEPVTYAPGDCIEIVIEHPSGKTHHGAIVSTVAKNLHPSMLDGIKKGEIMRWVAKSGKTDDVDGGSDDGEAVEKKDKSEKVKKPKKDKSNKGNNGKAKGHDRGRANPGNGR